MSRPATAAERELWLATQLETDQSVFTTAHGFTFAERIDADALATAWTSLQRRAPILTARFDATSGEPRVVPQPERVDSLAVHQIADARALSEDVRGTVFDPDTGPLTRAVLARTPDADTVLIAISHLAIDGYGWSLLLRDLGRCYAAAVAGEQPPEPRFGIAPAGLPDEAESAWWHEQLRRLPHPNHRGHRLRQARVRAQRTLAGAGSTAGIPRRALAAAALAVAELRSLRRVTVDVPFLARADAGLRTPMTAMNVVPIGIDVSTPRPARALLAECAELTAAARDHQHTRVEQAKRDFAATGRPVPVADVTMNFLPFTHELRLGEARSTAEILATGPGDAAAVAVRMQPDGTAVVEVDAPAADGTPSVAASEQLADAFLAAYERLDDESAEVGTPEAVPASPPVDVLQHIYQHVLSCPQHPVFLDGTTYAELWNDATSLAGQLRDLGSESRVAVCAPRGSSHAVGVLAALVAGAAFVPMPADEDAAAQRRRIADVTSLEAVLAVPDAPADLDVRRHTIARSQPVAQTAPPPVHPDTLAYVITTSGSTGTPKPVAVSRGALSGWVGAIAGDYLPLDGSDRVVQFSPVQFDASIEELFGALCGGATLAPRSDLALQNLADWLAECRDDGVTVLDLPTGFWHELTNALAAGIAELPETVHTVIIGGEAASAERVRQWREHAPPDVRLINTYGPTEATVVATWYQLAGG